MALRSTAELPAVGELLAGAYRVGGVIGRGGTSEVREGVEVATGRDVAVKIALLPDDVARTRLAREAEALMVLRHPAVVELLDAGTDSEGRPFLVMERVDGDDLVTWLSRRERLSAEETVRLLRPILDALEEAHGHGLVHRDLKPENIMVEEGDDGPRARLLDFGIVRVLEASEDARVTRGWLGTPAFMAPEQMTYGAQPGPTVDQWGFAVTLYEVIVGSLPFGHTPAELNESVPGAALPFPRNGSLDGRLFAVLARATRKHPDDRFQSASAMAAALDDWLSTRPPPAPEDRAPKGARDAETEPPPPRASLDEAIRAAFGD